MDANQYQDFTGTTEIYTETAKNWIDRSTQIEDWEAAKIDMLSFMYCAGKLNGESGEVAEVIFKAFRKQGIDTNDLAKLEKELGDVLWYVARLAALCGFTLSHIMEVNMKKLQDRKDRGVIQGYGDER